MSQKSREGRLESRLQGTGRRSQVPIGSVAHKSGMSPDLMGGEGDHSEGAGGLLSAGGEDPNIEELGMGLLSTSESRRFPLDSRSFRARAAREVCGGETKRNKGSDHWQLGRGMKTRQAAWHH